MAVLIDTSFLIAALVPKDQNHAKAQQVRHDLKDQQVILQPVLYELFYMIATRVNYREAVRIFDSIRSASFRIEVLTDADMARMTEIMSQYADAELDFADTAIMAVSERLQITEIFTFDRRDFGMFHPKHCEYLNLKP